MAKKILAVTGIKHNDEFFDAGEELDPSKFTKDQLKELHDNGAVVIKDDGKLEDVKAENLTPEQLGQTGAQSQDVSATAKASTAAQLGGPAKEVAPTKK